MTKLQELLKDKKFSVETNGILDNKTIEAISLFKN